LYFCGQDTPPSASTFKKGVVPPHIKIKCASPHKSKKRIAPSGIEKRYSPTSSLNTNREGPEKRAYQSPPIT